MRTDAASPRRRPPHWLRRIVAAFGVASLVACSASGEGTLGSTARASAPFGTFVPRAVAAASAAPTTTDTDPARTRLGAPQLVPETTATATGAIRHVVVIWMENHEATAVTSTSMPYLYGLARRYGRADRYYAVRHPSLPNYLAFWAGSTEGVTNDGTYNFTGTSISNQMTAAGLSWRTYAQDYPATTGCHTGTTYTGGVDGWGVAGTYVRRHDPAMSFTFVSRSSQCGNVRPLARFDPNVNLAFVVPNLCNDMHDCSMARGDAFLKAFVPHVLTAPDWAHTLLVITFDEGTTSTNGGGRVFTVVARQGLSGKVSTITHNHYGLLRTVERVFGLPCMRQSCNVSAMSEFLP
jgi:hypothetical protein